MKIYFSASIKGGRQLAELYALLIRHLKRYGEVLTEHIGNLSYCPSSRTPEEVYRTDRHLMDEADVVVAEVTVPSTGVGYELAYCEARSIPVLCLYAAQSADVSYMVCGNTYFTLRPYETPADALREADDFFKRISKKR